MNELSYISDFFLLICQFQEGSEEDLAFKGAEHSEFLFFSKNPSNLALLHQNESKKF